MMSPPRGAEGGIIFDVDDDDDVSTDDTSIEEQQVQEQYRLADRGLHWHDIYVYSLDVNRAMSPHGRAAGPGGVVVALGRSVRTAIIIHADSRSSQII